MRDLQTQAREYAGQKIARIGSVSMWTCDAYKMIAEAYEQGWVDRDTRDMKPETQDEIFNGE